MQCVRHNRSDVTDLGVLVREVRVTARAQQRTRYHEYRDGGEGNTRSQEQSRERLQPAWGDGWHSKVARGLDTPPDVFAKSQGEGGRGTGALQLFAQFPVFRVLVCSIHSSRL